MTIELTLLAWACLLAFVHLLLPGFFRTRQYGTAWNAGARDEPQAEPGTMAGRLSRAQSNYYESFPIFVAAILLVSVADVENEWTTLGAAIWLGARVAYLPIYAAGIAYIRSLVWLVSVVGLLMILSPTL